MTVQDDRAELRAQVAATNARVRAAECVCPSGECPWWECQIMDCQPGEPCAVPEVLPP